MKERERKGGRKRGSKKGRDGARERGGRSERERER